LGPRPKPLFCKKAFQNFIIAVGGIKGQDRLVVALASIGAFTNAVFGKAFRAMPGDSRNTFFLVD
jgi:hypothetical protein